jgi:hypothetical protein
MCSKLDRQIRVYDEAGTLLRRIGGAGEGPGEFGGSPSFGVVGDTVWAYDGRLERITLFDRRGNLLSTGRVVSLRIPLLARPLSHRARLNRSRCGVAAHGRRRPRCVSVGPRWACTRSPTSAVDRTVDPRCA